MSQRTLSTSLPAARRIVETWWDDYNAVRPHSALGNRAPREFAHQGGRNTPDGFYVPVDLIQGQVRMKERVIEAGRDQNYISPCLKPLRCTSSARNEQQFRTSRGKKHEQL